MMILQTLSSLLCSLEVVKISRSGSSLFLCLLFLLRPPPFFYFSVPLSLVSYSVGWCRSKFSGRFKRAGVWVTFFGFFLSFTVVIGSIYASSVVITHFACPSLFGGGFLPYILLGSFSAALFLALSYYCICNSLTMVTRTRAGALGLKR